MTNKVPKYPCKALDCPNNQSDIYLAAEKLLYSENLCDDPGCANTQDKNILDLKDGLRNLEHILCTMTQLCTEPECLARTATSAERTPCPIVPCKTEPKVLPTPNSDKPLKGYEKVAKELRELRALCNAGVCKSPACYNAYMGYNKVAHGECGSSTCVDPPPSKCGGKICPFTFIKPAKNTTEIDTQLPVGTCGTSPCPYADVDPKDQNPNTLCGSKNCPFAVQIKEENMECNDSKCLISPLTTIFCATSSVPCPYKYGTKFTHPYTNDKCFVQEAARPYSGSASPYDYLSSVENNYPFDMATHYPLFPITQPTPVPPCPYMTKKKKKSAVCGKPGCDTGDYFNNDMGICGIPKVFSCDSPNVNPCNSPDCKVFQNKQKLSTNYGGAQADNVCIYPTCPFGKGICGDLKMYSCDSPNVNPCESPDCKVFQSKQKSANKYDGAQADNFCINATCPYGKGICGDLRMYSCDSPNVNPCGSPDCKIQDSQVPESDLLNEVTPRPDTNKCHLKTCPFLDQLIFCTDCGGVMPGHSDEVVKNNELATKHIEVVASVSVINEAENNVQTNVEGEDAGLNKDENVVYKTPTLDVVNKAGNEINDNQATQIENLSLYSYPGVQLGHKDCFPQKPMVPQNMGWLWNCIPAYGNTKAWRGYKPGAIDRKVYNIIREHKRALGIIDETTESTKKKKSKYKFKIDDLKHYVEVKKREGDYTIVVNPVKDPSKIEAFENPFMDVTPLQFKIEKEKKPQREESDCPCDLDTDAQTESSHSSEFEFKFSPPAALPVSRTKKIRKMTTIETQYDPKDIPMPPKTAGGGKKKGKGKGNKGKKGKGGKKGGKKKK